MISNEQNPTYLVVNCLFNTESIHSKNLIARLFLDSEVETTRKKG